MKKLILTSACLLAVSGAAFAQGTLQWTTISFSFFTMATNTTESSYLSSGGVKALSNGTSGPTVGGAAGSYYFELLYNTSSSTAPTTLSSLETWSDTGLLGDNTSFANGARAQSLGSLSAASVPFTAATPIMIVEWSANLGTTWSAASSVLEGPAGNIPAGALFGETPVGTVTPFAATTSPGANPFSSTGIDSLLTPLYPVVAPEPTTIALGVVGGLSLLALRRKKA